MLQLGEPAPIPWSQRNKQNVALQKKKKNVIPSISFMATVYSYGQRTEIRRQNEKKKRKRKRKGVRLPF